MRLNTMDKIRMSHISHRLPVGSAGGLVLSAFIFTLSPAGVALAVSPLNDAGISTTIGSDTAAVYASSNVGGSITAFTFRGVQYIDTDDYGREIQSALWPNETEGQCFTPDQAGNSEGYS